MQYLGSFQNWNSTERYPLHEIIWREDYSILETAFSSSLILIIGREDSNNVFGSKVWKEICTSVEMYFNARYAYWISNLEIASLNQNLPQAFETASATTNGEDDFYNHTWVSEGVNEWTSEWVSEWVI